MPKLFSARDKKFLVQIKKTERELNLFIVENWKILFPDYIFIANEFSLKGNVRSTGSNGKIDILAYNPATNKFVIFELKKEHDRNITDQAADYRDFVQDNFPEVYLLATQKYNVTLPKYSDVNSSAVEIILVAKHFSLTQLDRLKKNNENNITFIRYYWFKEDLILLDYINNDPDELKIETANTKKLNEIKNILAKDPELFEIERFFGLVSKGKEVFIQFLTFLKNKGEVELDFKQTKIGITIGTVSFSGVKHGGKGGRMAILQINTDFDVSSLGEKGILFEDRYRGEGVKKKGSHGLERYEVFIRNADEMKIVCDFFDKFL